jgi:hypothetical protein
VSRAELTSIDWSLHGRAFYRALFENLRPFVWPFVVGTPCSGSRAGSSATIVLREILERRRAAGAAATAAASAGQAPPAGGVS